MTSWFILLWILCSCRNEEGSCRNEERSCRNEERSCSNARVMNSNMDCAKKHTTCCDTDFEPRFEKTPFSSSCGCEER